MIVVQLRIIASDEIEANAAADELRNFVGNGRVAFGRPHRGRVTASGRRSVLVYGTFQFESQEHDQAPDLPLV